MRMLTLVVLALSAGSILKAQDFRTRGQRRPAVTPPDTTTRVASAPPGTTWTPVSPGEWEARSPQLVGTYVEVNGGLGTQLLVSQRSSFSNTGWLLDSLGKQVGTVLFDQIADSIIPWMHKAKCAENCQGVFVRGIVVRSNGARGVTLRVIEVSYESRTGAAPAGSAALAIAAKDPDARKPLLPSGAVPNADGTLPAAVDTPSAAPPDTTHGHGLIGRLRSAGILRVSAGSGGRAAPAKRGAFHLGDRPVTETAYRNIRDTELYRVFASSPWNVGRNLWPRVALIVEEATAGIGGLGFMNWGDELQNRCWRIRAKLWTGQAASRDIAPFNWCLTEMRYDTLLVNSGGTVVSEGFRGLALWGRTPKASMTDRNTGPERTVGPNPPYLPVPRFHYSVDDYSDTIMLGNILRDMAFEYGVPDGRVWVVEVSRP